MEPTISYHALALALHAAMGRSEPQHCYEEALFEIGIATDNARRTALEAANQIARQAEQYAARACFSEVTVRMSDVVELHCAHAKKTALEETFALSFAAASSGFECKRAVNLIIAQLGESLPVVERQHWDRAFVATAAGLIRLALAFVAEDKEARAREREASVALAAARHQASKAARAARAAATRRERAEAKRTRDLLDSWKNKTETAKAS